MATTARTTTAPTTAAIDAAKQAAGEAAAVLVRSGMRVGLGTGSTADWATKAIGRRLADGSLTDIVAVATSEATQRLADQLDIPLATLATVPELDIAIDGADEIDPALDLIKGRGAALLREKIVARAARRFVVIADDSKLVPRLGRRVPLPVAVVAFAWQTHLAAIRALGGEPTLRVGPDGEAVLTDDGLLILDCLFADGIRDAAALEAALRDRPGIVASGLFLGMADTAFVAAADGVRVLRRRP